MGLILALVVALLQDPPPEPDANAQKETLKQIKDLFKEEYAKRGAAEQAALGQKLLQKGIETNDDAASKFVLLKEARDVASGAGERGDRPAQADRSAARRGFRRVEAGAGRSHHSGGKTDGLPADPVRAAGGVRPPDRGRAPRGDGTMGGLQWIDSKDWDSNETSYRSNRVFTDDAKKTVIISVRKNRVSVTADGRLLINWTADYKRVTPVNAVSNPSALHLGNWESSFEITQVQLIPVSGQGKRLR